MRRFRRRNRQSDQDSEFAPDDVSPLESDDAQFSDAAEDEDVAYNELDIEPFVPVSGEYYDDMESNSGETITQRVEPGSKPRRRLSLPHPSVRLPDSVNHIQWSYLLLAFSLFGTGIFGILLKRDEIQGDLADWWPLAIVSVSGLWMLMALVRRQIASFLGAAAVAGVGLSLLLDTQDIASVEETILGLVLVTAGLGIVIRGFLLRQQTV